jgi:hypothetical protein
MTPKERRELQLKNNERFTRLSPERQELWQAAECWSTTTVEEAEIDESAFLDALESLPIPTERERRILEAVKAYDEAREALRSAKARYEDSSFPEAEDAEAYARYANARINFELAENALHDVIRSRP